MVEDPFKNTAEEKAKEVVNASNAAANSAVSAAGSAASAVADWLFGEYRPPSKFHFRVDFPAFPSPTGYGFQEVSGMKVSWKTEEISEGGQNTYSHKVPGKLSYDSNLILKRGIVNLASPFVLWFKAFMEFGVDAIITKKMGPVQVNNLTQPCTVSLLDENGIPSMVWAFAGTYPVNWSYADLDSMDDNEVMIEEMELAYTYFMRMM